MALPLRGAMINCKLFPQNISAVLPAVHEKSSYLVKKGNEEADGGKKMKILKKNMGTEGEDAMEEVGERGKWCGRKENGKGDK